MKINPTQKPLPISTPQTVQSTGTGAGQSEFAKVLGNSMGEKSTGPVENAQFVPSVAGPDIRIQSDAQPVEWQAADRLLDALDAYRDLLGDPEASLKMVEPHVVKMKDLLAYNQPMLDQLPERNPVKQVLQQVAVDVSKEIERFRMGYYVDE